MCLQLPHPSKDKREPINNLDHRKHIAAHSVIVFRWSFLINQQLSKCMKKVILLMVSLLAGASMYAQEITITPSLNDAKQPQFQFSPDESYFLIQLGDEQQQEVKDLYGLADDNFVWMGADPDNGRNIWSWEETVAWADASGDNCFGGKGGYQSWRVATAKGWSGLGYNVSAKVPMDLHWINSDFSLHMALRSFTTQSIDIYLTDNNKTVAHLVFGQLAYDGIDPVADFPRDGQWYDVEISMTYLEDQFEFTYDGATAYADNNYLCALIGKSPGLSLDFDACFFHGPKVPVTSVIDVTPPEAPTAIESLCSENPSRQQSYDLQGRPIANNNGSNRQIIINTKRKVLQ